MPATVQIVEKNGVGGTVTDKTSGSIRFKNADNSTVDFVNPLVKPGAGFDFSFEKWLRLNVTGGTYSQITNVGAFSDGANGMGTGVDLFAKAVTAYATGARLSLGAGPFTGTGEKGDHLVMICRIGTTVAGGLTPSETLNIGWDEI